jgi:membrane-associated phospholipid phosphatase
MRRTVSNRVFATLLCLVFTGAFSPSSQAASKDKIEKSGDIVQLLIPAIAYGTTFYLDDSEGRGQFYKSFLTNLGVTYGLKYAIDKKRPDGGSHSFPSGHTSAAFPGAAFIHQRYGWKYAIPAYLGAAFVGYSRVESDNHYPEDVLAGAAIGAISSFYFTTPYKGITIAPVADRGYYGLTLKADF